jgi:DNA transformation protein
MFALVVRGVIYLKADETSAADFAREGSGPLIYMRSKSKGRPRRHALTYWRLPERLYDDPDEPAIWARRAFHIAQRKEMIARRGSKYRLTGNSVDRRRSRA